ncbi:MAG: hypothetical protein ACOCP8_04015 [archaeon]
MSGIGKRYNEDFKEMIIPKNKERFTNIYLVKLLNFLFYVVINSLDLILQ